MVFVGYIRDPLTYGAFLERLIKVHKCEVVSCNGGKVVVRTGYDPALSCAVIFSSESTIIDAQLLQSICRRLNLNSGDFGVPEVL